MSELITSQNAIDFEREVHFVSLGFLANDGQPLAVIGDRIGGVKRGVHLNEEQVVFLHSLDPDDAERSFTEHEKELLELFVSSGILRYFYSDSVFEEFTILPILRKDFALEEELEQGYLMRTSDGLTFELSEIGAHILRGVYSQKSFAEFLPDVEVELLADADNKASMEALHAEHGMSPAHQILDATFEFMGQMWETGTMTFEPVE